MSTESPVVPRVFTLEEANSTLPLVRVIVRDIVELAKSMVQTRQRLDLVASGNAEQPMYQDEVHDIEVKLNDDRERLQNYVDELVELGVEPKGLTEGLVDFPGMRKGKLIYLCWKYDEPEIEHWHSLTGGFVGRQPIDQFVD